MSSTVRRYHSNAARFVEDTVHVDMPALHARLRRLGRTGPLAENLIGHPVVIERFAIATERHCYGTATAASGSVTVSCTWDMRFRRSWNRSTTGTAGRILVFLTALSHIIHSRPDPLAMILVPDKRQGG